MSSPRRSLLAIGNLRSLEIVDPTTGREGRMSLRGIWLAWDQGRRNFVTCRVKGSTKAALPRHVESAHRRFHNAPPRGNPMIADACMRPVGKVEQIGLVKALTYTVPKNIHSPKKNKFSWHHAFGDTGHKGGDYSPRVMPMLLRDSAGNIFFKRRPGNIYRVDEWLRG